MSGDFRQESVHRAVEALARAVKIFRLYPPLHPSCEEVLSEAFSALQTFLVQNGETVGEAFEAIDQKAGVGCRVSSHCVTRRIAISWRGSN